MQGTLVSVLREKLDAKVKVLPTVMKRKFDQAFRYGFCFHPSCRLNALRYDERHVPRTWSPDVDVQAVFVNARVAALQVLEIFTDPAEELTIQGQPILALKAEQVRCSVCTCVRTVSLCGTSYSHTFHHCIKFKGGYHASTRKPPAHARPIALHHLTSLQLEEMREQLDQSITVAYQEALQIQKSLTKSVRPVPCDIKLK